jgi:hypothetical protein
MHNPHPHGQRVVQPHKIHDHLEHQQPGGAKKGVAKLPDAQRETWMTEHPYPNEFNPVPKESPGPAHGERVEPEDFGK